MKNTIDLNNPSCLLNFFLSLFASLSLVFLPITTYSQDESCPPSMIHVPGSTFEFTSALDAMYYDDVKSDTKKRYMAHGEVATDFIIRAYPDWPFEEASVNLSNFIGNCEGSETPFIVFTKGPYDCDPSVEECSYDAIASCECNSGCIYYSEDGDKFGHTFDSSKLEFKDPILLQTIYENLLACLQHTLDQGGAIDSSISDISCPSDNDIGNNYSIYSKVFVDANQDIPVKCDVPGSGTIELNDVYIIATEGPDPNSPIDNTVNCIN